MNKDDIMQLLLQGERITVECKRATTNVPDNVWDTYSAFANTYGGTILPDFVNASPESRIGTRKVKKWLDG